MTFKVYFRSLAVVQIAGIVSQVAVAGLLCLVFSRQRSFRFHPAEVYFYAALALALAAAVAGHSLFRARLEHARDKPVLADMLTEYRAAFVLRNVFPQMISTAAAVAYGLTGNIRFLAIVGFVVLLFVVWWPARAKLKDDLGLQGEPKLDDLDAVIGEAIVETHRS